MPRGRSGWWVLLAGAAFVIDVPALEDALLAAVNRERAAHRLAPVVADARLCDVARAHSRDMAARDFFGHFDPDGRGPGERLQRGYPEWVGTYAENVYHVEHADALLPDQSTPAALAHRVLTGWLGSPGHRENLLRPELTRSGLGAFVARGDVWITHDLGRPVAVLTAPLPSCARVGQGWSLALRLGPDLGEPGADPVQALLVWPDATRRFPLPDGSFLEGAQPLGYRRAGARLDLAVPPLSEPGTYRLRLGRSGRYFDLGAFRVQPSCAAP